MASIPKRLLLLAGLILPLACASAADPATAETAEAEAPAATGLTPLKMLTPEERAHLQMNLLTGELAAGRQQPDLAAQEFFKALQLVDDVELAQRTTSLALAARDEDLAMKAAQRWQALAPNEANPREVIVRLSLNRGDLAEAQRQCIALIEGSAGGVGDGLRQVAQILLLAGTERADNVLLLMQQLVARWPQEVAAHHSLALLALRHNRLPLAETAAERALQLAPDSREELLLTAGLRVRQQRLDDADAIIERLIASDTDPDDLRLGYAKLLLENAARDRARAQLEKLLKKNAANSDARYAIGVLDYNDRRYDDAERAFSQLLNGPRAMEAAFQLGRIEETRRNYVGALSYYERVQGGAQVLDAAVRRAGVLVQLGQTEPAHKIMQALRDELPQFSERFYLAEAEILREAGRYEQALVVYDAALKESAASADLLYGRSLVHERLGRIPQAESDLRAILADDADDARAMNALGYMLTVHTQRLKEARQLIERAHELEPEDAAILDSLGWVQFKLGDTAAARTLLQQAYDKLPDAEIAAHLGEVLWALGEKEQAQHLWQQALQNEPGHPVLQETVQRLTR